MASELSPNRERTKLLAVLTLTMLIAVVAVVAVRQHMIVEWPVIAGVATPWVALSIALRVRAETWGREGKVLDWWSVPHFVAGVLFGLFGIGAVIAAATAIVWEAVETVSRVREYPVNRVADIVLAFSGWILANLCAGGAFPVW